VDERIRVNDLNGCSQRGCIPFSAGRPVCSNDKQAANSFSSARQRIADGRPHRLGKDIGFVSGDFLIR
jgi:hypothetical protein